MHTHRSVKWYVVLSLRPMMTGVVPTVCFSTQLWSGMGWEVGVWDQLLRREGEGPSL